MADNRSAACSRRASFFASGTSMTEAAASTWAGGAEMPGAREGGDDLAGGTAGECG